jgi:tRNA1(Val) A37 N6-methylase TrmN6
MIHELEHTTIFNGNVTVWQPLKGYRFAIDSLLLAAFTPAQPNQRVLELGIGTGAASLALAYQHPDIQLHGVEIQPDILEITHKNILENGWENRFQLFSGDLRDKVNPGNCYDHVIMNPPFFQRNTYINAIYENKTISHAEGESTLTDWISAAHRALRQRGYLTLVHKASRLDEILTILSVKFGCIEVMPLWPKNGVPAKRVLVRARKSVNSPLTLHAGLTLHEPNGNFTSKAIEVIRFGKKLCA